MAHYAKISNDEFTVSERARLSEAESEKNVIEANNIASEEYATLKTAYENSFTSVTLQTLEGEMATLKSQYIPEMAQEERTALDSLVDDKQLPSEFKPELSTTACTSSCRNELANDLSD